MVLTGLLPECRAAMELGERERRRLEGEVTKAVVEAQEIVVSMLREYREVTRRARAAKQEALDSWWAAERTRQLPVQLANAKTVETCCKLTLSELPLASGKVAEHTGMVSEAASRAGTASRPRCPCGGAGRG